jgi:hypothetical protein
MTRMRVWLLTALVALALGINFVLLSPRIAQSAEETVRAQLAAATNEVREQMELRDARLNPRLEAESPALADSLRPPPDPTLPVPKPDEKALRAALAAAQPVDPDLLIVATADGAAYARHGKPAVLTDDTKDLPLVKATLALAPDSMPGPATFVAFDGSLFRVQSAKIPGGLGVVVTGLLVDDHLAAQMRAAADIDVTLFLNGQIVASSVPDGKRGDLVNWVKSPRPGYGAMPLRLVMVGNMFDGKLPRGASRYAVRVASVPFEGGVLAALTVNGFQHFGWLGRYQAYYLLACLAFLIFGLIWGLLPGDPKAAVAVVQPIRPTTIQLPERVTEAATRAEAALAGANDPGPKTPVPQELPWTDGEQGWGNLGQSIKANPSAGEPAVTPFAKAPEDPFTGAPAASKPAAEASSAAANASSIADSPMLAIAAMPLFPEPQTPSGLELDLAASPPPKDEESKPSESFPTAPAAAERDPFAFEAPAAGSALALSAGLFTELEPSLPGTEPAPQLAPTLSADPFAQLAGPTASTPGHLAAGTAPAGTDTSIFDRSARSFDQPLAGESDPFAPAPLAPPMPDEPASKHDASMPAPTDEFSKPNPAFSFASLLDEDVPPPPQATAAPTSDDSFANYQSEETRNGPPPSELLAQAGHQHEQHQHDRAHDNHGDSYRDPGDEPTRIEAVSAALLSAALLDKLREKDEPAAANEQAAHAEPSHAPPEHGLADEEDSESTRVDAAPPMHQEPVHAEPVHAEPVHDELGAQGHAEEAPADPDEAHFEDTYRQFIELRRETGEPADKVSYEKFVAKLRKNREELLAKHSARGVRFSVYLKDGRAAIKASAIR